MTQNKITIAYLKSLPKTLFFMAALVVLQFAALAYSAITKTNVFFVNTLILVAMLTTVAVEQCRDRKWKADDRTKP